MLLIPFKGLPEDVVPQLTEFLPGIVGTPPVSRFCFGCTSYLPTARDRHDCSDLFPLYATENHHHAVQIEGVLSNTFGRHPNYVEDVAYDAGADIPSETWYVYLAVWLEGSDKHIAMA